MNATSIRTINDMAMDIHDTATFHAGIIANIIENGNSLILHGDELAGLERLFRNLADSAFTIVDETIVAECRNGSSLRGEHDE